MKQNVKDDTGRKVLKHVVVYNPEERDVLDTIYNLIVNKKYSLPDVAVYLNKRGILTRQKKKWSKDIINMMLRNKDGMTGIAKITVKLPDNGGAETFEIKIPKLFTEQKYKTLRKAIASNTRGGTKNPDNDNFLFRGRLVCGICGRTFHARRSGPNSRYRYYACPNAVKSLKALAPGEEKCKAPWVPMKEFDDTNWHYLTDDLFQYPQKQLQAWQKSNKDKTDDVIKKKNRLKKIKKALIKNKAESGRILKLYIKGLYPVDKLEALEKENAEQKEVLTDDQMELIADIEKVEGPSLPKKQLKSAADEIKALAKRCKDKALLAPLVERQKLLDYLLGPNPSLIVWADQFKDDDGKTIDTYYIESIPLNMDVFGFINALKVLDATGHVPPFVSYTDDKDHSHGPIHSNMGCTDF